VSDNPKTFTAWITDARLLQKEGGGIRMLRAQVREQGSSVVRQGRALRREASVICHTCRGIGKTRQGAPWNPQWLPCPVCGGCGIYDHNSDTYRLGSRDEGRIWHRTREAAVARANDMRNARIDSLGRQIGRLWKMEF
jgi:hypothetical protein